MNNPILEIIGWKFSEVIFRYSLSLYYNNCGYSHCGDSFFLDPNDRTEGRTAEWWSGYQRRLAELAEGSGMLWVSFSERGEVISVRS